MLNNIKIYTSKEDIIKNSILGENSVGFITKSDDTYLYTVAGSNQKIISSPDLRKYIGNLIRIMYEGLFPSEGKIIIEADTPYGLEIIYRFN